MGNAHFCQAFQKAFESSGEPPPSKANSLSSIEGDTHFSTVRPQYRRRFFKPKISFISVLEMESTVSAYATSTSSCLRKILGLPRGKRPGAGPAQALPVRAPQAPNHSGCITAGGPSRLGRPETLLGGFKVLRNQKVAELPEATTGPGVP